MQTELNMPFFLMVTLSRGRCSPVWNYRAGEGTVQFIPEVGDPRHVSIYIQVLALDSFCLELVAHGYLVYPNSH